MEEILVFPNFSVNPVSLFFWVLFVQVHSHLMGFRVFLLLFHSIIAVDEQDRAENDVFWVRLIQTHNS